MCSPSIGMSRFSKKNNVLVCSSAVFADKLHDPGFVQSCSLKRVTFTSLKSSLIFGNWLQLALSNPARALDFWNQRMNPEDFYTLCVYHCLPLFTCVGNTLNKTRLSNFAGPLQGCLGVLWAVGVVGLILGLLGQLLAATGKPGKMWKDVQTRHDSKDDSKLGKSSAAFSFHSGLERSLLTFPSRCTRPSLCPTHASRKRSRGEGHNWRGCHEAPSRIFIGKAFHQLQRFARRTSPNTVCKLKTSSLQIYQVKDPNPDSSSVFPVCCLAGRIEQIVRLCWNREPLQEIAREACHYNSTTVQVEWWKLLQWHAKQPQVHLLHNWLQLSKIGTKKTSKSGATNHKNKTCLFLSLWMSVISGISADLCTLVPSDWVFVTTSKASDTAAHATPLTTWQHLTRTSQPSKGSGHVFGLCQWTMLQWIFHLHVLRLEQTWEETLEQAENPAGCLSACRLLSQGFFWLICDDLCVPIAKDNCPQASHNHTRPSMGVKHLWIVKAYTPFPWALSSKRRSKLTESYSEKTLLVRGQGDSTTQVFEMYLKCIWYCSLL